MNFLSGGGSLFNLLSGRCVYKNRFISDDYSLQFSKLAVSLMETILGNSIYHRESYHRINKTAYITKFTYKMEKYIAKNDSDELNSIYIYHLTATDLLVAIVKKQIDPVELAIKELKNRGLDENGKWVGF